MIPKPKFSTRSRAQFVVGDMERDPSLTCSAACARAGIGLPLFLTMLNRPKHRDLRRRYDVVRHPRAGHDQPIRGQTKMTRWIK